MEESKQVRFSISFFYRKFHIKTLTNINVKNFQEKNTKRQEMDRSGYRKLKKKVV